MSNKVLPELIRQAGDVRGLNEAWDIVRSTMNRGSPRVCVQLRQLHVPFDESKRAEVVRAHELMHIRVSPPDLRPWVKRKRATEDLLMVAEEIRVNEILNRQGYKADKHLFDETDVINADRFTRQGDLEGVVKLVAATYGTATQDQVISKIEEVAIEIGDLSIFFGVEDVVSQIRDILGSYYTSGLTDDRCLKGSKNKATTRGFLVTEELATMLGTYIQLSKINDKLPTFKRKPDTKKNGRPPQFADLVEGKVPLNRLHNGNMGKVRIACDTGRSPRRMNRWLTDPHRRVFDRTRRKNGGIVLVDCSGSMSMSSSDLLEILKHAPGATIAGYCHTPKTTNVPNFWVLAKDGKMAEGLPSGRGMGNGVDGPALRWAIKSRRFANEPIVWVCDGAVTDGASDGYYDTLGMEAKELVRQGKIVMQSTVSRGIDFLKKLSQGSVSPFGPTYVGEIARC